MRGGAPGICCPRHPSHTTACLCLALFAPCRKSLDEVVRLASAGAVRVTTSHRFSLEEAPDAFAVLLNRQVCWVMLGPCCEGYL